MQTWHYNRKVGLPLNKFLGNTNTSNLVSDFIVGNFVDFTKITKETTFLEPAVGTGSFYFALLDQLLSLGHSLEHVVENQLYAFDVDGNAITILKDKLKNDYGYEANEHTKVFLKDFLTHDFGDLLFDYVVTNPPYISNKNIRFDSVLYKSKEDYLQTLQLLIDENISNVSDIYVYFHIKSLQLLKNGGKSIFLCSDSWIDGKFGDVIKSYILNKNKTDIDKYHLDVLLNSQLHPFFRDDTNAIVTVVSKNTKNETTKIIPLKTSLEDVVKNGFDLFEVSAKELNTLMTSKDIINKRNAIILFYDKYFEINNFFLKHRNCFQRVTDLFDISSTSLTQNTMLSSGMLIENDETHKDDIKLFWQIQSRINKVPDYKNHIADHSLQYVVDLSKVPPKFDDNVVSGNIYMSTIIDRFPLLFYTDLATFHASKYFSLSGKNGENLKQKEAVFYLNNVFTLLDMENCLKEGTRKTLRKGEQGLAKEIKISDLGQIKIPVEIDFSLVQENVDRYVENVIYNIEDALQDKDYWTIQKHIAKSLNMEDELCFVVRNLIYLYVLRMRNLRKIEDFENYFNKTYRHLF